MWEGKELPSLALVEPSLPRMQQISVAALIRPRICSSENCLKNSVVLQKQFENREKRWTQ